MNNYNNSFSYPNSSELSHASSKANEGHHHTTSPTPFIENTTSITEPQIGAFTYGIGGSSIDSDVGGDVGGKPRGRPPGSKNKPKDNLNERVAHNVTIIYVPPEADVINWVLKFAESKQTSVSILSASGLISLVDLYSANSTDPPSSISGPLDLISFSGTFLWPSSSSSSSSSIASFFSALLVRSDHQIFAGVIASRMIAMSHVMLVVTTFNNAYI